MSSKKLGRRLRTISSKSNGNGTEGSIIDELFGLDLSPNKHEGNETGAFLGKKTKIDDLPDTILENIFHLLDEEDLMSLRLVNKRWCEKGTTIFRLVHSPIRINSDAKIHLFRNDMKTTLDFPFSRFSITLEPITKHLLISFTQSYEEYIKQLWLQPFDKATFEEKFSTENRNQFFTHEPSQRLVWKLTATIKELIDIEELNIVFPSMSNFDYWSLEFDYNFDLERLKVLSITFPESSFSDFSSELTLNILKHAENLMQLRMKLSEPSHSGMEAAQLKRILSASVDVPKIALTVTVKTRENTILKAIRNVINDKGLRNIRVLTICLGRSFVDYGMISKLLKTAKDMVVSLQIFRNIKKGQQPMINRYESLSLPPMPKLRFLHVDSHQIPLTDLQFQNFPSLVDLKLHLKYGNEEFYKASKLHPKKLKLQFHETSIMKVVVPDECMQDLVSKRLVKMELVNPPPGHLTFMSDWGKNIESLIISAPKAYGDDPSYQVDKVLGQITGKMQFRDGHWSDLCSLPRLKVLHLLLPIDDEMACFLAKRISPLWELIVDDTKVSKNIIPWMKARHNIYISWTYSCEVANVRRGIFYNH